MEIISLRLVNNEYYLSRENSIITDIFYIQMINTFVYICGHKSYSIQKLLNIPPYYYKLIIKIYP